MSEGTAPRIIRRRGFHLVGVPLFGNPLHDDFAKAWELFGQIVNETPGLRRRQRLYGLQIYPPAYPQPFEFVYLAGVQVGAGVATPLRCLRKELPPSAYAVFDVIGGPKGIDNAYRRAYKNWLPSSDYVQAFPYDFEQYDAPAGAEKDSSRISVWVPIRRRT